MVGAATETLCFLLPWEHVGGDRASSISDLQILFSSCFCPSRRETHKLRLSWGPSQEACSAFLARRWQHLYCEQVLWECACERMCHTCVQAYPLGNLELQQAGSGVAQADLSLLGETDTDTDCCNLVWQRT